MDKKPTVPWGELASEVSQFFSGWQVGIAAIAAALIAFANLIAVMKAQAPIVTPLLTIAALVMAARIVFARTSVETDGQTTHVPKYSTAWRWSAGIILFGMPVMLALALGLYFRWLASSDGIVVTTAAFNASNVGQSVPCDLGGALADNLDSEIRGTGARNITVKHIDYPVSGWGRSAHWWARQYGKLTKSDVVIFGNYWDGGGSTVVIEPEIETLRPFNLERAHRIPAVLLPPIAVARNDVCLTGLSTTGATLLSETRAYAMLLVGLAAIEDGRSADAIAAFNAALKPDIGFHYLIEYYLAQAYEQTGDYENDAKALDDALHDNNPLSLVNRGRLYEWMGEYSRAKAMYTKALAVDPNNVLALYNSGVVDRYQLGNYDDATEELQSAAEMVVDPTNPYLIADRGSAEMAIQSYAAATADFARAVNMQPSPQNLIEYAGALSSLKTPNWSAAIDALNRAVNSAEDKIHSELALATAYQHDGQHALSVQHLKNVTRLLPENDWDLLDQGEALATLNRCSDAITRFRSALQYQDKNPEVYDQMGRCRLAQRAYAAAREDFSRAASMDQLNGNYLNDLGRVMAAQGDRRGAQLEYASAIAIFRGERDSGDCAIVHKNLAAAGGTDNSKC